MNQIDEIIVDRVILKITNYSYFKDKYYMSKLDFDQRFKSINKLKEYYRDNLVVKCLKLFQSRVQADQKIYKWNKQQKSAGNIKAYAFTHYSKIDEKGKSIKTSENFSLFFKDVKRQYDLQRIHLLKLELDWIGNKVDNVTNECACYYCGIGEDVLRVLYLDKNFTCKTKRNRGSWFELDRKDSRKRNNLYQGSNIVLACYFCNNHKSDVVSCKDMRFYFGKAMFQFLLNQYSIVKSKNIN